MGLFLFSFRNVLSQRQKGFILWEVVIGLAVFGVIAGAGMKMWKIVDQGRFVRTCEQIQTIVTQLRHYKCVHAGLPEESALENSQALSMASSKIWDTLSEEQWIDGVSSSAIHPSKVYPKNALGGGAGLVRATFNERSGIWLVLAKETQHGLNGALFTPKEAERLSTTWGDGSPDSINFSAKEGMGISEGGCVEGKSFSKNSHRSCIVYLFVMD
ncbi:type II secretion system protein [Holospora elegans]|uniref:type II secretion system protein n=1 Tax=Holospora elegans TaxID=431043 RepID=UPI0013924885|nr:type II secretion system protein [Holospora elegans]